MARTIAIIENPSLNNRVVNGVTTLGLIAQVNAYFATLTNPTVRGWSLDARIIEKRMNIQWMFTVVTDSAGAALVNPFTLNIQQATSSAQLATALNAIYAVALPTQFLSATRITKLDSDGQNYAKQFVAASLQNVLAAAVANYNTDIV